MPPPTYEELNSGTLDPAPFADLFGDADNIFGQVGLMHLHGLLPVHPLTARDCVSPVPASALRHVACSPDAVAVVIAHSMQRR